MLTRLWGDAGRLQVIHPCLEKSADMDLCVMLAPLQRRGWRVYVTEVARRDWLRIGRSLLSPAYWRGACTVDPGYRWYLQRVRAAVDAARRECRADQARGRLNRRMHAGAAGACM